MNPSATRSDVQDQLVAGFLHDMERAEDQSATLRQYQEMHPEMAKEFASLAALAGRLDQARPIDHVALPKYLGEFQIVRRIGVSMDEVYEAWQPSLKRRVAIKTIRRGRISPQSRERFLRQQLVLADLHQTHIVPIFAAGEDGPLQYFVMPFIEGAALHHVISTVRDLEAAQTGGSTPSLRELAERAAQKQPDETPAAAISTVDGAATSAGSPAKSAVKQQTRRA